VTVAGRAAREWPAIMEVRAAAGGRLRSRRVLLLRLRVRVSGGRTFPLLAILAVFACGCGDAADVRPGDVRTYSVPRALAPPAVAARPASATGGMPAAAGLQLRYEVPEGWSDLGADGMRLATFAIGDAAAGRQVTVIPASGTLRGNVERWQGQLEPTADAAARTAAVDAALAGVETVAVDGRDATVVWLPDSTAAANDAAGRAILGAVIPLDESRSLFVKYLGDAAVARRERERFVAFVRSLRWN
jgi:hypothetical protein